MKNRDHRYNNFDLSLTHPVDLVSNNFRDTVKIFPEVISDFNFQEPQLTYFLRG